MRESDKAEAFRQAASMIVTSQAAKCSVVYDIAREVWSLYWKEVQKPLRERRSNFSLISPAVGKRCSDI